MAGSEPLELGSFGIAIRRAQKALGFGAAGDIKILVSADATAVAGASGKAADASHQHPALVGTLAVQITNSIQMGHTGAAYLVAYDGTRTMFIGADTGNIGIVGTLSGHDIEFRTANTNRGHLRNADGILAITAGVGNATADHNHGNPNSNGETGHSHNHTHGFDHYHGGVTLGTDITATATKFSAATTQTNADATGSSGHIHGIGATGGQSNSHTHTG